MTNVKNTNPKLSVPSQRALTSIEAFAKDTADAAKYHLENASLADYIQFLDVMYHYTRYSGIKCSKVSELVTSPDIQELFKEFDEEEASHYKLAQKDLQAFAYVPSTSEPHVIKLVDDMWVHLELKHENAFLGMVYVFENIAKYLQEDIPNFVQRLGLQDNEITWLKTHGEADLEHGEIIRKTLEVHLDKNPEAAIYGARIAHALWISMLSYGFDSSFMQCKAA